MVGSMAAKSVVVVGAGIVGAASAYFLARRGHRVRLLDAAAPAAAASGASDGAVSVASKRPGPMMTAALAGIALYRDLARAGIFADLFKARSTIIVAEDDAEAQKLAQHADTLSGEGMTLRRIEGETLRHDLPSISRRVKLAIEIRDEGHAVGYEIVRRLIAMSGIAVDRNTPVTRLIEDASGRAIIAVETPRGRIGADHVVITAGCGSAKLVGLEGLLRPRKGQLIITERSPKLAALLPGSIMSCRYLLSKDSIPTPGGQAHRRFGPVIDPLRTGQFLIGGTREETGDTDNDIAAVRRMLASAVSLLPELQKLRVIRIFAGVRSATCDALPIVGKIPRYANLVVAAGFEGDGICLGPLIGRTVSELVMGEAPIIDLSPFDPGRFVQRSLVE